MGLSASQARFLGLTGRKSEIEYRAQSIEAQKLALATQKDGLYEDYCAALDATKIQVAFRGDDNIKSWQKATYKALCTYVGDARFNEYALRDNRSGLLVESAEVAKNYERFGGDKYAFALSMMGANLNEAGAGWSEIGNSEMAKNAYNNFEMTPTFTGGGSSIMSAVEIEAYEKYGAEDSLLSEMYEAIEIANGNVQTADSSEKAEAIKERTELVTAFRDQLYKNTDIRNYVISNLNQQNDGWGSDKSWDSDFQDEFNFWCRKFEAIQQAGGCKAVDATYEDGETGETWLKNMVEAGLVTILENKDPDGTSANWKDTSVATSTNGNYLSEVQDDKDLKKAEAIYEHELEIINKKDTKFNNDLSKLETERSAIKTELEGLKTIINDNIEKTMNIFS